MAIVNLLLEKDENISVLTATQFGGYFVFMATAKAR